MNCELYFSDQTAKNPEFEDQLRPLFSFCAQELRPGQRLVLSLTLVEAKTSRELNRRYRDSDKVADVITFAYLDDKDELASGLPIVDLGEMVLCPEAVEARAAEVGNNFSAEMRYLFIHGFLHLLGYDHVGSEDEAEVMYSLQEDLFSRYQEVNMDIEKIREECLAARDLSYSPYSKFKVGAVVVLKDGTMVRGANIENSAFGLSMCAERNAIFGAYLRGYQRDDIALLALIASSPKLVTPCGSCRQVMSELMNPQTPVYLWTIEGEELVTDVASLLPYSFNSENLKKSA